MRIIYDIIISYNNFRKVLFCLPINISLFNPYNNFIKWYTIPKNLLRSAMKLNILSRYEKAYYKDTCVWGTGPDSVLTGLLNAKYPRVSQIHREQ